MTVTNPRRSVTHNGNGVTTVFPVANDGPIYFLNATELVVTLIDADGTETRLMLGAGYSVSGAGNPSGGSVTTVTPPAADQKLRIERLVPLVQPTQYPENTKFPAASHERALDRLTMVDQQQQEDLSRAPKFPKGHGLDDVPLPVPEDGKAFYYDAETGRYINGKYDFDILYDISVENREATEQAKDRAILAETRANTARDRSEAARDIAEGFRDDAADSASASLTYKTQAELAALAAGAPLFTSEPDLGSAPSPYLLQVDAGTQVWTHDGTARTMVGWLGRVSFKDVEALLSWPFTLGPVGTIAEAATFRYKVVSALETDSHVVTSGGVRLNVIPSPDFNVRAFGALGISTDDTAAIQKAVTAGAGVAPVRIPPGVYMVDSAVNTMPFPWKGGIEIPSNTHLIIEPGATIREITNDRPKRIVFSLYSVDNVTIEGGGAIIGDRNTHTYANYFDTLAQLHSGDFRTKSNYDPDPFVPQSGDVATVWNDTSANNGTYSFNGTEWVRTGPIIPSSYFTHEFGFGICLYNSRNVRIRDLEVSDFTGDSIFIGNTPNGPTPALPSNGGSDIWVTGCLLARSRRQGISVVEPDNVFILGNKFKDIGTRQNMQDGTAPRSGIDIEAGRVDAKSDNVIIDGNIFEGCVNASVTGFDGNNIVISNNVADSRINYGYTANGTISGNVLRGAGISGGSPRTVMNFTYVQAGTVMTCTFASEHRLLTGSTGYFAFLDPTTGFASHSGVFEVLTVPSSTTLTIDVPNYISSSGNGEFNFPRHNMAIVGNSIYTGGIFVRGKNVTVTGNLVFNAPQDSIYIGIDVENAIIANNIVEGAVNGIGGAAGSKNVTIAGNRISKCSDRAVRSYPDGALITGNVIRNSLGGIEIAAGRAVIRDNDIDLSEYLGSTIAAIRATASATPFLEIEGNTIRNDKSDIVVDVRRPAEISRNKILGMTGRIAISTTTADASGNLLDGNTIESNRTETTTSIGILLGSGVDSARLIDNKIRFKQAAFLRAIDTSDATNSRLISNKHQGPLLTAGTDSLAGNVEY